MTEPIASYKRKLLPKGNVLELDIQSHDWDAYRSAFEAELEPELRTWSSDDAENTASLTAIAYRLLVSHAPQALIDELLRFPYSLDAPAALLVRGMPVDKPLPPTPQLPPAPGTVSPVRVPVAEAVLLGVGRILGAPLCVPGERNARGGLVRNQVPVNPDGVRPFKELSFHRDFAGVALGHRAEPECFMLLGLRGDPAHEAHTTVVDHRIALAAANPSDVELLRTARVCATAENADGTPMAMIQRFGGSYWTPVEGTPDDPRVTFFSWDFGTHDDGARFGVVSDTEGAADAYERMHAAARDAADLVDVRNGDLLILNNQRCCHGRTAFMPFKHAHPEQRWLAKMYVSFNSWKRPGAMSQRGDGLVAYPELVWDNKALAK